MLFYINKLFGMVRKPFLKPLKDQILFGVRADPKSLEHLTNKLETLSEKDWNTILSVMEGYTRCEHKNLCIRFLISSIPVENKTINLNPVFLIEILKSFVNHLDYRKSNNRTIDDAFSDNIEIMNNFILERKEVISKSYFSKMLLCELEDPSNYTSLYEFQWIKTISKLFLSSDFEIRIIEDGYNRICKVLNHLETTKAYNPISNYSLEIANEILNELTKKRLNLIVDEKEATIKRPIKAL